MAQAHAQSHNQPVTGTERRHALGRRFARFSGAAVAALAATEVALTIGNGVSHLTATPAALLSWFAGAVVSYALSRWAWNRTGRPDVLAIAEAQRGALAAVDRDLGDDRACLGCLLGGGVDATVGDDDHLGGEPAHRSRHPLDDRANRAFLVVGGDHQRDGRKRGHALPVGAGSSSSTSASVAASAR